MLRKWIIAATLVAVILGAVGLPTNVHACAMKGTEAAAPTCGMCAKQHEEKGGDSEKRGCCDNRTELRHTDPASSLKAGVTLPSPAVVAVLVWSVLSFEPVSSGHSFVSLRSHSPPYALRKQSSYLFNSSFLI